MPFNLSQIFGGWRRKESGTRKPSGSGREKSRGISPPSPSLTKGGGVGGGFPASQKNKSVPASAKGQSELAWRLIVSSHISEKAAALSEASLAESRRGKYVFKVSDDADKHVLKRAIEDRYGVDVASVNTIPARSKVRRHGQILGTKPGFKKAVVTLKAGQTISEY